MMRDILDEFHILLGESAAYHRQNDALTAMFQDAMQNVMLLRQASEAIARRYIIGLVGASNVGKSTLLNAIFGGEITPRRNGPCTEAPIEFEYGEKYQVHVNFRQQLKRPSWQCDSIEDVHNRLNALACDADSGAGQLIDRLVVRIPHPILSQEMIISDTPGFGAAQRGSADDRHEQTLKKYLHKSISKVFWVVLADQGIMDREKKFHDDFFADICNDIIVTGSEDWDEKDRSRFRKRYQKILSKPLLRFHFVSGKLGMKARQTADTELLEQSGIPLIERLFAELGNPKERIQSLCHSLVTLCEDIHYWVEEYERDQGRKLACVWRLDSFYRWKYFCKTDPLKQQMDAILSQLHRK